MTQWTCTLCHEEISDPKPEYCPNCSADAAMILDREKELPQDLEAARTRARTLLKGFCAAYPACDGNFDKICQREAYGKPIGFGGAGQGISFRANTQALLDIRLKTSVVGDHFVPDTTTRIFGKDIEFPVMASSTAGVQGYNQVMDETQFCKAVVRGAKEAGTIALRGDTWFYTPESYPGLDSIEDSGGWGIQIFKPRSQDVIKSLIERAEAIGCIAVGVDLDGCGSTNMAAHGQPVFRKSVGDIKELVSFSSLPFIAKGVMTADDAQKCAEAGVSAIGVSNHGGRVLDGTPGVAEVLHNIRQAVGKEMTLTADGGVRTGYDVLKMLALGADAVMLGRDLIRAAVGGGTLGVRLHLNHIKKVLRHAMLMTGTRTIEMAGPRIIENFKP
ncbi:MAG: alpha-hydroxy-acid oxidizing protein [Desulfobacteraceae bacterium]|nr:MAG: alpha-hydroxy-acid oxidizing protein [Desulfobacteraceae bacterium]